MICIKVFCVPCDVLAHDGISEFSWFVDNVFFIDLLGHKKAVWKLMKSIPFPLYKSLYVPIEKPKIYFREDIWFFLGGGRMKQKLIAFIQKF